MARLRNPRKDEYDEIFNFLERIFKYGEIGYNPSNAKKWFDSIDTEDILVMEEDNKIVSHVLMKPYRLYILGSIINGAEVGAVATDERYRGRGFAFTLLNESLQMMAERGYDISTLGGFRDRYARLGWERGGAVCTYVINNRSIRYAGNYKDVLIEKYDPSDDVMRRAIIKAYEKNEVHAIRSEVEHRLTYDAPMYFGTEVLIAHNLDEFSYVMIRRKENDKSIKVLEYGGDPQTLILSLRRIFDEENLNEAVVSSPNWYTKFTPFLERVSENWWISPVRQINIINLNNCLKKMLQHSKERIKDVLSKLSDTYSVKLRIRDGSQEATILFDRECSIIDENGEEELSLNKCEMVRLLFGPNKPSNTFKMSRRMASYLDLIFPLPFYKWVTDMA